MTDLQTKLDLIFLSHQRQHESGRRKTQNPPPPLLIWDIQTALLRIWPDQDLPGHDHIEEELRVHPRVIKKSKRYRHQDHFPELDDRPIRSTPAFNVSDWSDDEFQELINAYPCPLHEHSIPIQELARRLSRRSRVVENQMGMLKSLDTGSSWGNINSRLKELWNQQKAPHAAIDCARKSRIEGTSLDKEQAHRGEGQEGSDMQYPDRFRKWSAEKEGSVKRPFIESSGKLSDSLIETEIIGRLKSLAKDLQDGETFPPVIILAGGAGNGKSRALEEFLTDCCGAQFDKYRDNLIQVFNSSDRKIELKEDVHIGLPLEGNKLVVIQDASETNEEGTDASALLAEDIHLALNREQHVICCVNRGILEGARAICVEKEWHFASDVLHHASSALNRSSLSTDCWPLNSGGIGEIINKFTDEGDKPRLEKDDRIYVWPMDLDEVVNSDTESELLKTVIDEIAEKDRWDSTVLLAKRSPLMHNRELIEKKEMQAWLDRCLTEFQLITGGNWSFRDLYSLLSYIMIGGKWGDSNKKAPSELSNDLSAESKHLSDLERTEFNLKRLTSTLPHALFPILPDGEWLREVLSEELKSQDLPRLQGVSQFLTESKERSLQKSNTTHDKIYGAFQKIDPAVCRFDRQTRMFKYERLFSHSIAMAFEKLCHEQFISQGSIEFEVIKDLADCEAELTRVIEEFGAGGAKSLRAQEEAAKKSVWLIRKIACALFKRSFAWRLEASRQSVSLQKYVECLNNQDELRALSKKLQKKLSPNGSRYVLNLGRVFGQSEYNDVPASIDVRLKIKPEQKSISDRRPKSIYAELSISSDESKTHIPVTFELFQLLDGGDGEVLESCMWPEQRAVIDRVCLLIEGAALRCPDAEIEIEVLGKPIEHDGSKVRFV